MKFIHLSDLHIGRRLGEYSLIDDQRTMLWGLLDIIRAEMPDALLIAGDIYDKTVPAAEAVALLDAFLTDAAAITRIFLIAGNHDSPERISFGGRLMEQSGVCLCGTYDGQTHRFTLRDRYGDVNIYLLPYIRTADVRRYFPDEDTDTFDAAFGVAVSALNIDRNARNVIVAHQFVTGGVRAESETGFIGGTNADGSTNSVGTANSVGGTDAVDAAHFAPFDYAALGHLHRAQNCPTDNSRDGNGCIIRYSGTPMAYSVSEADDEKSVSIVQMGEKGDVAVRTCPIKPPRRICCLRGTYDALMAQDFYRDTDYRDSYVRITLTDEEDIPDALYRLRTVYPYLLRLEYDNTRTRTVQSFDAAEDAAEMHPAVLFDTFYREQNGLDMDEEMKRYMDGLIGCLWEEELS